jgi:hypothetical protein
MDLSSYILEGFEILPKKLVSINGVSDIPVIFNQSNHRDNKTLGGYEPDNDGIIMVQTSYLTAPKQLKGKIVIMDSENWRIVTVRYGESVTSLTLQSVDKA